MHYSDNVYRIRCHLSQFGFEDSLTFVVQQMETKKLLTATGLINFEMGYASPPRESKLEMTLEDAQELSNSLWEAGVRPAGAAGSAGAMAAVQEHLKDLRALVFKTDKS